MLITNCPCDLVCYIHVLVYKEGKWNQLTQKGNLFHVNKLLFLFPYLNLVALNMSTANIGAQLSAQKQHQAEYPIPL